VPSCDRSKMPGDMAMAAAPVESHRSSGRPTNEVSLPEPAGTGSGLRLVAATRRLGLGNKARDRTGGRPGLRTVRMGIATRRGQTGEFPKRGPHGMVAAGIRGGGGHRECIDERIEPRAVRISGMRRMRGSAIPIARHKSRMDVAWPLPWVSSCKTLDRLRHARKAEVKQDRAGCVERQHWA